MAHGAPHDAAEHIAATFVRGQDAIGDQEGRGAKVIGDDARAGAVLRPARRPDDIMDRGDQCPEQVDVVIVVDALEDRGDALQPHPRVDRRSRQRDPLIGGDLLVLHEDEVPDLDEPVAVLLRRTGRTAGYVLAVIVEDLRAGAAGAGIAHRPEIVARRDADDARLRKAGDLPPQAEGLVVLGIDGHQKTVLRQAELLGDQRPGKLDRALLEIVAEGEIAEHLEEGVMPRRVADIVEIVVLATGAHAFLGSDGTRIRRRGLAGEIVLELDHAGIGEHQRRIVVRNERTRRHNRVVVALEVAQEMRPDVVDAAHLGTCTVGRGALHRSAARVLTPRAQVCPEQRSSGGRGGPPWSRQRGDHCFG